MLSWQRKIKDNKDLIAGKIGKNIKVGDTDLVYHTITHPVLDTPLELLVKEEKGRAVARSRWEPTEGGWGTAEIANLVNSPSLADEVLLKVGITKPQE